MKYENDNRKIYINKHNIPVATIKPLNQEQKAKIDEIFGVGEILSIRQYENFKDFIDYSDTRFLNLSQIVSDDLNTMSFPSDEKTLSIFKSQFDYNKYDFYFSRIDDMVKYSIPERFKKLGVNISYIFDYEKVNFKNHSIEKTKKIDNSGNYYGAINAIDFTVPVFVFDRKEKAENEEHNSNFIRSAYTYFSNNSMSFLVHELKHAFNRYTLVNTLKYKKISPEDYLKIEKYEEYSAEIEAIFYFVNMKKLLEKNVSNYTYHTPFRLTNIENYLKVNENYYDNLGDFIKFVKKEVKENYLEKFSTKYNDDYYLQNVTVQISQFPNHFANKTDDGVYETLKRSLLSFEILNPYTEKRELVDLSSYFEDNEISSKEKYLLNKKFRSSKNMVRVLRNKTKISNKTLKILNNELTR